MRNIKKAKKIVRTKRRKQTSRSFLQKAVITGKVIIILLILSLISFLYISREEIANNFYKYTADLGFKTKNIVIEGQKYTSNKQIASTLKIKEGMPIFSISLDDLKTRLEKIEWIKHAIITRRLPNDIHIYIIERTPIALGQKDHKLHIIDDEGFIIREKKLDQHLHLPIIIGDGAENYANSLMEILKVDPELFKHIAAVIRVNEHRWNVRFDNDIEVKLPEKDLKKSWAKVIKMYKNKVLFDPKNIVIDLRIPNKIYIEKK